MESAKDVERVAKVFGGLYKKGRSGGWTHRVFALTDNKFMYFESMHSKSPSFSISVNSILRVEADIHDELKKFVFLVGTTVKMLTLRAKSKDEQSLWCDSLREFKAVEKKSMEPEVDFSDDEILLHAERMIQQSLRTSNTELFDTIRWIQDYYQLSREASIPIVKRMISLGIICATNEDWELRSSSQFKICASDPIFEHEPEIKDSIDEIRTRFGTKSFDVEEYAHDFFVNNHHKDSKNHRQELINQKKLSVDQLKEGVYDHYRSFIHASCEIRKMEEYMRQLIETLSESTKSVRLLQTFRESLSEKDDVEQDDVPNILSDSDMEKDSDFRKWELLENLRLLLITKQYTEFALQQCEVRRVLFQQERDDGRLMESSKSVYEEELEAMVVEFSNQVLIDTREAITEGRYDDETKALLQLLAQHGHEVEAQTLFLQHFSLDLHRWFGSVDETGRNDAFATTLATFFFTSMLCCVQDWQRIFNCYESNLVGNLVTWTYSRVEMYWAVVAPFVFDYESCVIGDAQEDFNMLDQRCKSVYTSFKEIYYGASQVELEGLPTVQYISTLIKPDFLHFIQAYLTNLKSVLQQSVEKDDWHTEQMSLRKSSGNEYQPETLNITSCCRWLSQYLQRVTKNLQYVLHPSFGTSKMDEVGEQVVSFFHTLFGDFSSAVFQAISCDTCEASQSALDKIIAQWNDLYFVREICVRNVAHSLTVIFQYTLLYDKEKFIDQVLCSLMVTQDKFLQYVATVVQQYFVCIQNLTMGHTENELKTEERQTVLDVESIEAWMKRLEEAFTETDGIEKGKFTALQVLSHLCSNISQAEEWKGQFTPTKQSIDTLLKGMHSLYSHVDTEYKQSAPYKELAALKKSMMSVYRKHLRDAREEDDTVKENESTDQINF